MISISSRRYWYARTPAGITREGCYPLWYRLYTRVILGWDWSTTPGDIYFK